MNRRVFLRLFGSAAAAAVAIDPEELLWVPGTKKFFFPPVRGMVEPTLDEIIRFTMEHITPKTTDVIFTQNPLFVRLKNSNSRMVIRG